MRQSLARSVESPLSSTVTSRATSRRPARRRPPCWAQFGAPWTRSRSPRNGQLERSASGACACPGRGRPGEALRTDPRPGPPDWGRTGVRPGLDLGRRGQRGPQRGRASGIGRDVDSGRHARPWQDLWREPAQTSHVRGFRCQQAQPHRPEAGARTGDDRRRPDPVRSRSVPAQLGDACGSPRRRLRIAVPRSRGRGVHIPVFRDLLGGDPALPGRPPLRRPPLRP